MPWDKVFGACSISVQSAAPLKDAFFPEFVETLCVK